MVITGVQKGQTTCSRSSCQWESGDRAQRLWLANLSPFFCLLRLDDSNKMLLLQLETICFYIYVPSGLLSCALGQYCLGHLKEILLVLPLYSRYTWRNQRFSLLSLLSLPLFFFFNFALAELGAMVSALKEKKAFSVYIYSAPLLHRPRQEAFWGHMAYKIKKWMKLKCTVYHGCDALNSKGFQRFVISHCCPSSILLASYVHVCAYFSFCL